MAALAMEIQNWEPHVSWGRMGGQQGAWGEEVGGQEGVRASGGEGRARDGLGTASSVWFVGLARVCSYWWRAFLFWDRGDRIFSFLVGARER